MNFVIGQTYTREQIGNVLGGNKQAYLPTRDGRVVCGAFKRQANPDAPDVVLVGLGPRIRRSAEILERQNSPIPVFVKLRPGAWKFEGRFRLFRSSTDGAEISQHALSANRAGDVSKLLFFQRAA